MSSYRTQYRPDIGIGGPITPGIKGLIIANVSVFALQVLTARFGGGGIEDLFGLNAERVISDLWLWQFVTYMFLHSTQSIMHILLNMLMLWMFGTDIERLWGTRLFLKYYFICGVGAAITTSLLFRHSLTIGASGAVFGVMLAYAMQYPRRQVLFMMFVPMPASTFVLICIGVEAFSLLGLPDGVAHIAHLGGVLFGYLYLKKFWRWRDFWRDLRWKLRRRRFRVMPHDDDSYPFH